MADLNIGINVVAGPAKKALNDTAKATNNLSKSIAKAQGSSQKMGKQFNSTAVSLNKFGKGAMQQLGYQVADFAVQVQNGTNALQAFGQQGSQMLAVFGPVGAILGAVVAIGSALGTAFGGGIADMLGFTEEAEKSSDAAGELSSALSELSNTYEISVISSLTAARNAFGDFNETFAESLKFARDQSIVMAFSKIRSSSEAAGTAIEESVEALIEIRKASKLVQGGADPMVDSLKKFKSVLEEVEFTAEFTSDGLHKLVNEFASFKGQFGGQADNEIKGFITTLLSAIQQIEKFSGSKSAKGIREGFAEATQEITEQNEQLALRTQLLGSADSVMKKELSYAKLAKDIQEAKGQLLQGEVNKRTQAIEAQFKLNFAAERLQEIDSNSQKAIKSQEANAARRQREKEAEAKRAKAKLDAAERSYATALTQIDLQTKALRIQNRMFGEAKSEIDEQVKLRQILSRFQEQGKKLTSGELIALKEKFGLLQEEAGLLERKKEEQKLQKEEAKAAYSEWKKFNAERERAQLRINQLIGDGFRTAGDALAGLINGTNTWRQALDQVLRKVINIVAQMGQTKSGGFSFGKLAAGLGGLFLGGGNPNAPTSGFTNSGQMFDKFHTGGKIGGRNGQMPGLRSDERMIVGQTGERVLSRGQTAQGGSGGVVINQTINLSTGVQQTVRAEVMSLAPQIAAQAKAAVLDAKKRGGGFGAAFA